MLCRQGLSLPSRGPNAVGSTEHLAEKAEMWGRVAGDEAKGAGKDFQERVVPEIT